MFDSREYKVKMQAIVVHFENEMKKVRTGRAHPDMLSNLKVEIYGQFMPLSHAANITVQDANMLIVTPFDPANIQAISNAIRSDSTLNFNPSDNGRCIRISIPPLTEERRQEIVKTSSAKVENAKIALRQIRDEARKELKNAKDLPEDLVKKGEKEMDEMTGKFTDKINAKFKDKTKEIMQV